MGSGRFRCLLPVHQVENEHKIRATRICCMPSHVEHNFMRTDAYERKLRYAALGITPDTCRIVTFTLFQKLIRAMLSTRSASAFSS